MKFLFFDLFYSLRVSPLDIGSSFGSFIVFDVFSYLVVFCFSVIYFVFSFMYLSFSFFWTCCTDISGSVRFSISGYSFDLNFFDYFVISIPVSFCYFSISSCVNYSYQFDVLSGFFFLVNIVCYQWGWRFYYQPGFYFDSGFNTFFSFFRDSCEVGLLLPFFVNSLIVLTSLDVIHSIGSDTYGFKVDAVPGHSNSFVFNCELPGVSYVYCSEFCGVNHSFMGFNIETVSFFDFELFLGLL